MSSSDMHYEWTQIRMVSFWGSWNRLGRGREGGRQHGLSTHYASVPALDACVFVISPNTHNAILRQFYSCPHFIEVKLEGSRGSRIQLESDRTGIGATLTWF